MTQYEEDPFEAMDREDLEEFARQANERLEALGEEFKQLQTAAEANAHVDMSVIDRWRSWMDTLEDERNGWADTATAMSVQNKKLSKNLDTAIETLRSTVMTLETVVGIGEKSISEGKRVLSLKRSFTRIVELSTNEITRAYNNVLGWPADEIAEEGEEMDDPPEESGAPDESMMEQNADAT